MLMVAYIAVLGGLLLVAVLLTGWWRLALAPWRISSRKMTIERLGLVVAEADVERANGILRHFAGGFNAMLTSPSESGWRRYCDSVPVHFQPFVHEGAAMGHTPRRMFRCEPETFEAEMVNPTPGMGYLHYVGLGFWAGMGNYSPERLAGVVGGLDPLHGHLCYDGYGFKHAFFDYPSNPAVLEKLDGFEGYARNAAYQGVGRAFWFLFSGDPELLIEHTRRLDDYTGDVAAGVGLASVFVNPDRLEGALELGRRLPEEWHDDFHLGTCFGLKARSINDPGQFERDLARADARVREAVLASVGECDRVEAETRSQRGRDGYQRWRALVTEWMASHVEYPLAGLKSLSPAPTGLEPARTEGSLKHDRSGSC